LKSNHLGTVKDGSIACVATAQHLGRNTQVWDAVVTDEVTGRKIALFRCADDSLAESLTFPSCHAWAVRKSMIGSIP
jgi:hypothetical protein